MAEFQQNLWAPWRLEYLGNITEARAACFLCAYRDDPAADAKNWVCFRRTRCFGVLNRFPYSTGHLLISPLDHQCELAALPDETLNEIILSIRDATRSLREMLRCEGFNVGINLGSCAGAGLPGHLHWHIVPRWTGDTNFMPVIGDVKVIPEVLTRIHERFVATWKT
ncbi:MAG: HIT domain-containing protein [Phycisphaerae bacterium]|nr:HIT domain-containing protein [Phycisphaerae bacterium]